ncbi:hypothetical protein AB0N12_22290, partial [Streptomyces albogriseolus]|uniref:hypothetical protein n=1 Tax=Streptomyces albogriseolus TaxID=1887 RepID=UPI00345FDBDF
MRGAREIFSRRQSLAILGGIAAGTALPLGVFGSRPAYAADPAPADGGVGLPDTDRAKAVRAYRTGGLAVRT